MCDVTNKAEVDEVAADVIRTVGDVDILVNNAGMYVIIVQLCFIKLLK